jgi:hypothetical protein
MKGFREVYRKKNPAPEIRRGIEQLVFLENVLPKSGRTKTDGRSQAAPTGGIAISELRCS